MATVVIKDGNKDLQEEMEGARNNLKPKSKTEPLIDTGENGIGTDFGTIEDDNNTEYEESLEESVSYDFSNAEDVAKYSKEWQERQWAREDELRKEQQQRDDTAYRRMVSDMVSAGINPNLVSGTPNYGTTTQTTTNTGTGLSESNNALYNAIYETLGEAGIEQQQKDRIANVWLTILQTLTSFVGTFFGAKG